MKKEELILNIFFGLSLIYWGFAGFIQNYEHFLHSPARIFTTILNITVGILIISRKSVIKLGSQKSILISLPSLILGGVIFKLSQPMNLWNLYSEILFIFGGIFALVSFLFLGRNFAIIPAIRNIVANGTYRIVRHPAYLGELIMTIACVIASQNFYTVFIIILFLPLLILRIKEEEKLLSEDKNYKKYQEITKWRLIPFIW